MTRSDCYERYNRAKNRYNKARFELDVVFSDDQYIKTPPPTQSMHDPTQHMQEKKDETKSGQNKQKKLATPS